MFSGCSNSWTQKLLVLGQWSFIPRNASSNPQQTSQSFRTEHNQANFRGVRNYSELQQIFLRFRRRWVMWRLHKFASVKALFPSCVWNMSTANSAHLPTNTTVKGRARQFHTVAISQILIAIKNLHCRFFKKPPRSEVLYGTHLQNAMRGVRFTHTSSVSSNITLIIIEWCSTAFR